MELRHQENGDDGPDVIFLDVPANERWVAAASLALFCVLCAAGFVLTRGLGAAVGSSIGVGAALGAFGATHFSLALRQRQIPVVTLDAFDATRRAGTIALAAFKLQHPGLAQISWSRLSASPDSIVVSVRAHVGRSTIGPGRVYSIGFANDEANEVDALHHPSMDLSQAIRRAECSRTWR